ncbi:hypothetical protein P9D30_04000 [Bacillus licheniformis]|uniref:hypothetical protein n=1 Tax=Bacillus licheniformis TaxID=1402 RepID=UPI002DBB763C|nr:hypothetical protein [Bacillus licheniformis]MEC1365628.1 hypothetical protein [Bacillus licheniformis]MEC1465430.1 hypothetical protein [Bacillus licheniformis]
MRRKFGPLTILEYICLVLLAALFIFPLILIYIVAQRYILDGLGGSGTGIK